MTTILAQDFGSSSPAIPWWDLSPMLALVVGALVLLLAGALTPPWPRGAYAWATAGIATVAAGLTGWRWYEMEHVPDDAGSIELVSMGPRTLVRGALAFDSLALLLTFAICVSVVLVALLADGNLEHRSAQTPEPYGLFLAAAAGAIVMASANDLMVLFLGLETLSLALYVLASSNRRNRGSQEAGFKYFILGGFASALFLYGVALLYGATGTTRIGQIVASFQQAPALGGRDMFLLAGTALMVVGFAFKIGAVPFHFWQPDVYQGAPSSVTGFMASVGKIGAFAAIMRVVVIGLPFERDDWVPVMWVLAVLSLVFGAVMAVTQTNVKRMLAYSSINHAGFMLVAVVAAGIKAGERSDLGPGMPALATYLVLYAVLVIGSFGVVALVSASTGGDASLEAFNGLARRRPSLALMLSVFLLAQAGVPLTSGFIAKFGAIQAAVAEGRYTLAVIAMVTAVIAAFLYLRIMVSVWFKGADDGPSGDTIPVPFSNWLALAAAAIATIVIGIFPEPLLDLTDTVTSYVIG